MTFTPRFLQPADPKDFTGQRKLINDFRKTIMNFKTTKPPNNSLIVISEFGNGKSSLLQMFEKTAEAEKMLLLHIDIPDVQERMFEQINEFLLKMRAVEKKGRFSKGKRDVPLPTIRAAVDFKPLMAAFSDNFSERELEKPVMIAIDDADLFFEMQKIHLFEGLLELSITLHRISLPVFFVIALSNHRWEQMQERYSHLPNMIIERMEFSEAEILLRKIGNEVLQNDAEFRTEVLKLGDRSPFNITFTADVVDFFTQEINTDGGALSSEQVKQIQDKALPYLRNMNYLGFTAKIFGFSDPETQLLSRLLESNSPVLVVKELLQQGVNPERLRPFTKCNLLKKTDNEHIRFMSFAFYEKAGRKSEIDVLSQIELMSNLVAMDFAEGRKPSSSIVDRLVALTEGLSGGPNPDAKPLATKMEQLFKLTMNKKQFYAAFCFANATERIYTLCGDQEGLGIFLEDAARKFVDIGKLHYGKELFEKSVAVFAHSEWKMKSSAREAANLYYDLANLAEKDNQSGLIRAYLWKAITLYQIAGENERAQSCIDRAVGTYKKKGDKASEFFSDLLKNEIKSKLPQSESETETDTESETEA